jgi:hypothetical protein
VSRARELVPCLIDINNGFEPERYTAVLDHLNRVLCYDGFELQQQGIRVRLGLTGPVAAVLEPIHCSSSGANISSPIVILQTDH